MKTYFKLILLVSAMSPTILSAQYETIDTDLPGIFKSQFPQTRRRIDLETVKASSHTILAVTRSTYPQMPEYAPEAVGDILVGTSTYGVYYATCTGSISCWKLIPGTTQAAPAVASTNPDTSTGAVAKLDFDEGGTSTMTADSVTPVINGNLFTSNSIASMWSSTGVNSTSEVHTGVTTGSVVFQDDDRWSGHSGASGKQSWCVVINPDSLTINMIYVSKGIGFADQSEFEVGFTNSCGGSDFCVEYANGAQSVRNIAKPTSTGMFAAAKSTDVCWSYDATQAGSSRIQFYFGGAVAPTTTNTAGTPTTINGTAPLFFGRTRPSDINYGPANIERIRIFNYVASKETAQNYNDDILVISRIKEDPTFKWWYETNLKPYGFTTRHIVKNDYLFNHPIDFLDRHDFQTEQQIKSRRDFRMAVDKKMMDEFFARKRGKYGWTVLAK